MKGRKKRKKADKEIRGRRNREKRRTTSQNKTEKRGKKRKTRACDKFKILRVSDQFSKLKGITKILKTRDYSHTFNEKKNTQTHTVILDP